MRARIVRSPRLWRSASAPLIVSVWFACAFVALRLAYRLIFGGWPETLDSWGSTVGGVIRTSLPFVAVVVFFGALNTVVDVSSALTRWGGRGPLRNMRTALVIALASYPSLLSSIRRVNASRRMRGDRSVASLIMPVLERSLERGVALGAAMEQRGFGSTETTYGMCDAPIVARNFSVGFGSLAQPTWTLNVGDLTIAHGSCVLLTGPTGSGKTALLHALTGRLQHSAGGWQQGVLEVGGFDRRSALPNETASFVSLVDQNVRDGFVASTVFDEIAFGLRLTGHRRDADPSVEEAVVAMARKMDIERLLEREIHALSAGEATLVALAAGLVTAPSLLLLDEPIADLDATSAARVVTVLKELRASTGITMVVAEHRWADLVGLADVRLDLDLKPIPERDTSGAQVHARSFPPSSTESHRNQQSPITPLIAPNGAGKTTWLSGFAQSHPQNVRLVPEDPSLLFSRESVASECAHNDRLARVTAGTTQEMAKRLLPDLPMDAHPRDLSTGQRLALACALQAAPHPDLLLLDEPTRGLDEYARTQLTDMLIEVSTTGTAVIFATHDEAFAAQFANGVSVS